MDTNEKQIERIDKETFDFNGKRYCKATLEAYLLELARQAGLDLVDERDLDQAVDTAYDNGYEEGREAVCDDDDESKATYKCAHCDKELCGEMVGRLTDRVTPSIDDKDIANVVFELSDYNASCRS